MCRRDGSITFCSTLALIPLARLLQRFQGLTVQFFVGIFAQQYTQREYTDEELNRQTLELLEEASQRDER